MSSYPAEFDPVPIQKQVQPSISSPMSISTQTQTLYQPQLPQPQPQLPQKTYKYFPAPPLITTYHQYQDVNKDDNLQHMETLYFLDKTLDWIKHDKSFKKFKKFEKFLKGPEGYEIMHKILKLFVRRGNTNWYDLKIQKSLVKDYIRHKLSKY
jgi:hypothetical protein